MHIRTSSEAQEKNWRQDEEIKKFSLMIQAWKGEQQHSSYAIFPKDQKHKKLGKGHPTK